MASTTTGRDVENARSPTVTPNNRVPPTAEAFANWTMVTAAMGFAAASQAIDLILRSQR
jgi:tRNA A37 threonylcarbamoyladenosine dehydratase